VRSRRGCHGASCCPRNAACLSWVLGFGYQLHAWSRLSEGLLTPWLPTVPLVPTRGCQQCQRHRFCKAESKRRPPHHGAGCGESWQLQPAVSAGVNLVAARTPVSGRPLFAVASLVACTGFKLVQPVLSSVYLVPSRFSRAMRRTL